MNYLVFLTAFLGILLHLLVKYRDALTKKETFPWKEHLLIAILGAIVMTVVIIGWEQAKVYFMLEGDLLPFTAFLLGYAADSLIKNISRFNPVKKQ